MQLKNISAFVLGLVMVVSAIVIPQMGNAQGERTIVYLYKTGDATPLLQHGGISILSEQDTYLIAEVEHSALEYMSGKGIPFRPVSSKIMLQRTIFDTSIPETIPSSMRLDAGSGMKLIQFVGPILPQWTDSLQLMGVKIYNYIPDYAILADVPSDAVEKVSRLSYVRWMGSFDPMEKVSKSLDYASGKVPVTLMISDFETARSVAYRIVKAGGGIDYMSQNRPSIVDARMDASIIPQIASLPGVLWIEPKAQMVLMNANASKTVQNIKGWNTSIWDRGIRGENQVLGISDSGLNENHSAFKSVPGKVACYIVMPGANRGDEKDYSYHGSHTSGTLVGYDPGNTVNKGMAYMGSVCIADVGRVGGTGLYVPSDLRDMYTLMIPYDVKVISNSWGRGYDSTLAGKYLTHSYTADAFMWENPENLLVFAQGNADHSKDGKVMSPSTAKSLISAGGTDNGNMTPRPQENAYVASSSGPTEDGRIKPTVMAPANPVYSVDGSKDSGDIGMAGTSMATPVVAGTSALVRQYFKEGWYPLGEKRADNGFNASASLIKAVVMNSADDMTGTDVTAPIPNNVEGWGRMDLENTLYFSGKSRTMKVIDFKEGIGTGEFMDFTYNISAGEPLKITLVWTDYPGSTSAFKQLVNDLDLIVTAPNGTVYYGNNFANGESKAGGSPDSTNVEEQVLIKSPGAGLYKIRVIASNAPMGPQPYALVVTSKFNMEQGTVRLDKAAYGEDQTVKITLEDNSFAGSSIVQVPVKVWSDTETTPETIQLSGRFGVLKGSIDTTLVSPAADGKISVSHGDTITVEYTDTSPAGKSYATAKVDLRTPAITNVHVEAITDSSALVLWSTTSSSTSTVYYGKTPSDVTNKSKKVVVPQLSVLHQVLLTGLEPQTLYYFDVESTDRGGHTVLADNAGKHYTFTTMAIADILLINGGGVGDDSTYHYMETYAKAFADAGWSMNTMTLEITGLPTLATLQKYKVVFFESGIDKYPPVTKDMADLIKDYNDHGGRLLVSGHDIGWALIDPGSGYTQPWGRTFVCTQLKADWKSDPVSTQWKQLKGFAGDPISGDFTAGINYQTARNGADGEELGVCHAGGTSVINWKNDMDLNVAVRWNSSADNGTAGQGFWGGTPSKVVYDSFEIFRITDPTTRAQVLNLTFVWLIGHAAPTVKFTSPSAGKVQGTVTVSWDPKSFGGTNIKTQTLYLSEDNGQGWFPIASIPPGTKTYSWDTTKYNNGDKYKLKIVVADDGTPSLSGSDISGTLIIANPNGDKIGPIVVPGSVQFDPNPGKSGMPIFINATIDDTNSGVSNISGAEVFFDTPGQNGTGLAMNASDLCWDSPVEDVFFFGNLSLSVGTHKIYVHGLDAAGNWGPFTNVSLTVNAGTPNYSAPPKVLYYAPTGDNVSLSTQVMALFSKPMNWTATKGAFSVKDSGGNAVAGSMFTSGNTLVFTPSGLLDWGTTYTATVTTAAKDENDIPLQSNFTWNFTTIPYFGWIEGKVTADVGGVIAGALIRVLNQTGEVANTTTKSDGTYVVGVEPGTYSVNASKPTYLPAQKDNIIVKPGKFTSGVDLMLELGVGIITGNVTCSGAPVAGASLKLYDENGALVKTGSTPVNGKYTMTDIIMGVYALNASKPGVGEKNVTGIVVQPKKTTWQNIELCGAPPSTGDIKGKVLNPSGSGLAGASVSVKFKSNGTVAGSDTTGSDGSYEVLGLIPDTYTVTATLTNYNPGSDDAVVKGGETTWVNITLTPISGAGTISGTVKDQDGAPIEGAKVTATDGTISLSADTVSDGSYTITNVPPGTYTVTASKTGYKSAQKTGIPDNSTNVDFVLTMIKVLSSIPANGAVDIAIDASITITFSVPMNRTSVMNALTLTPSAGDLTPSWNADNTSVTITHSANFEYNKAYTLKITTDATDEDGNRMAQEFMITFTTVSGEQPPPDIGIYIGIGAVIAIIIIAVILFAVLKMRKKPAEGEEKKEETKPAEEKKEEPETETKEEPKPEEAKEEPPAEPKPEEAGELIP